MAATPNLSDMNTTNNIEVLNVGGLKARLHEERQLEALFCELARQAHTREQRYKMAVLAWLQTTTVDCIVGFLGSGAIAPWSQIEIETRARADAEALSKKDWAKLVDFLAQGARQRAKVYVELGISCTERLREFHAYLIAHASAQIDFAELEVTGSHERSLDSILQLLEVPTILPRSNVSS